jgi:hypothetical protein
VAVRKIHELMQVSQPAWPALQDELRQTSVTIDIRPVDADRAQDTLHRVQVTVGSRLGAMALHTGGLLVDHGWLRVLGGGDPSIGLVDLATANGLDGEPAAPATFLVGFDVVGGRFEVNGAAPAAVGRPGDPGEICYFAPEDLTWHALGMGHGEWLSWLAAGNTVAFYAGVRWPDWQDEVKGLPADHGLAIYPFLFTEEAMADLAGTQRAAIPIEQVFGVNDSFAAQLEGPADQSFTITTD